MKILVIGDLISDAYIFGRAERLCPEAPVPVIIPERRDARLGGAGLVAQQLKELGAEILSRYGSYSEKTRYFAGNHLVCRVDNDSLEWSAHCNFKDAPMGPSLDWADAIVVSDYGKGAMSEGLARKLVETGKPLFVDAKHHWEWYQGRHVTAFPNEHEGCDLTISNFGVVARKLGARGCRLEVHDRDFTMTNIPATVSEVVDVTGAGDIFMAGFVYAWSIQLPVEDCLRFANALAGESCRHVGTYVVPREFAQEVLGRMLGQVKYERLLLDSTPGSTPSELRQPPVPDQWSASAAETMNSQLADCEPDEVARATGLYSTHGRIVPESPSVPTPPLGAPLPTDQESSDEQDRRLR